MDSTYYLRFLFVLFPTYVTCLGNYEGNMPTANLQRTPAHTFPVIGPEVKQMGNLNNPVYSSARLTHHQGTRGSYDDAHKERLFTGSNVKSDSKDCQTSAKTDNQDNHMITYKPSASVPKYDLSGFGQPSAQYESHASADAFKNVQPSSQLASATSQSRSTLMRTLRLPEPNPLKPSRGEFSFEVAKTAGSNKVFAVKPPKSTHGQMEFNSGVSRDPLVRGPNHGSTSISSPISHQHSSSQGSQSTSKVQTASGSYGPFLRGIPVYSSMNPRKTPHSGLKYTEAKPSVVSSGPIFLVQGGESAQGLGGFSGPPASVKPPGVPSHVDPHQASQISRDTRLTASSPLQHSMSGTQHSPSSEPRKTSKSDCRDNVGESSIASSGGILLKAPESAQRNKLPPNYETAHPKLQQTYNIPGQPSQIFKPMYPSRSGAQRDVTKSSIVSSGAIHIIQAPANVQNRAEFSKPKVHPSFPERKVPFAPGQSAPQYQPFEVTQNIRNVQPATSTYASSSQTGYQALSSVKGAPFRQSSVPLKPSKNKLGFSATNPSIAGTNKINTVHVRLNKPPTSSFGSFQNQWAFGDRSGAFQSSHGQRPGQNVQKPASSSAHCSTGVQSQDGTRLITAIPSGFGQGAIRRISPTLSSSYRQAEQVDSLDSLASKCEVTQNSPAGLGQQGQVRFQEVNLSI